MTNAMSREKWLQERKKGIGGSDAAAVLGLNPYVSPYALWAEKTNRLPEKDDNEAMRQGRDLEQYVAERFMEASGKKVRRKKAMMRNLTYPFAHANIDRWVVGENAGLECKTTSILNLKKFKNGEYPETYYCQCVHYMAVTGADKWYLAVLILNQGFQYFVIERDEEEIAALMQAEQEFWHYVETDSPPPVDGMPPTEDALKTIYKEGRQEGSIDLFDRQALIRDWETNKEIIEKCKRRLDEIKQTFMADLGDYELGFCGNHLVQWKNRSRSTFDSKRFISDHAQLDYSGYFKTTNYRQFEIKEA